MVCFLPSGCWGYRRRTAIGCGSRTVARNRRASTGENQRSSGTQYPPRADRHPTDRQPTDRGHSRCRAMHITPFARTLSRAATSTPGHKTTGDRAPGHRPYGQTSPQVADPRKGAGPIMVAAIERFINAGIVRFRLRSRAAMARAVRLTGAAVAAFVVAQVLFPGHRADPRAADRAARRRGHPQGHRHQRRPAGRQRHRRRAARGRLLRIVGLTWWSLGVLVAVSILVGQLLRLGPHLLEVPISAMLVLAVGGAEAAATDRISRDPARCGRRCRGQHRVPARGPGRHRRRRRAPVRLRTGQAARRRRHRAARADHRAAGGPLDGRRPDAEPARPAHRQGAGRTPRTAGG